MRMKNPVLIEWYDAYAQVEPEPTPSDISMIIRTVGFLLPQENELYVGYAQDYNEKLDSYQGITYIPRGMIKQVIQLEPVSELRGPTEARTRAHAMP